MYKTLCVAVLLLATIVFTSGSKPADASATGLPSPVVVAKGKLFNQTTSITTTTLFTPASTGLYRLTVYATVSSADQSSFQGWNYVLTWADDAGAESSNNILAVNANATPPNAWGSSTFLSPGCVSTFEAIANSPVTYSFEQTGPSSTAISLYWVVERLE